MNTNITITKPLYYYNEQKYFLIQCSITTLYTFRNSISHQFTHLQNQNYGKSGFLTALDVQNFNFKDLGNQLEYWNKF